MNLIRLLLLLSCVASLSACSSSNSGTVLPDRELDGEAPRIEYVFPEESSVSDVATNYTLELQFTELLDLDSITESFEVISKNIRDINSTITKGESINVRESDVRDLKVDHNEVLYTVGVEGNNGTVSDQERVTSNVVLAPLSRFALATSYRVAIDEQLKDLSPIESINPVTGLPATGNFLEGQFFFEFRTQDGEWQTEATVGTTLSSSSGGKFSSSDSISGAYWLEPVSGRVRLLGDVFDESLEEFASADGNAAPSRLDFIASVDSLEPSLTPSLLLDVKTLSVSSSASLVCLSWIQEVDLIPVRSRTYLRCGDVDELNARITWRPRILLADDDPASAPTGITVRAIANEAYVSFLSGGAIKLHHADFDAPGSVIITPFTSTFGPSVVLEYRLVVVPSVQSEAQPRLIYLLDNRLDSDPATRDYAVHELAVNGGTVGSERVVYASDNPLGNVSGGYDYFGGGFVGFTELANGLEEFYTTRLNGGIWEDPVRVPVDGAASLLDAVVTVFEEGHALFSWATLKSTLYSVSVQGYFPVDGGVSFARTAPIVLASSSSSIDELLVTPDSEGNAILHYVDGTSSVRAFRFVDNYRWLDAWNSQGVIASGDLISSFELAEIAQDGRMVAIYTASRGGSTRSFYRLFTDTP